MKVISVVNTKGGTGKSTIATNLAAIAASKGKRVLLIDSDGKQASSLSFRALREKTNEKIREDNLSKQAKDKKDEFKDFTAQSLPTPLIFKEVQNYKDFDYIIIDAGAGENDVVRSAIAASTFGILIIPCQPSPYDIFATSDTLEILSACRVTLDIKAVLLLNMVFSDKRIKILKDVDESLTDLAKEYDVERLENSVTNYIAYKNSASQGLAVTEYEPKGKAAADMIDLYDEIIGKLEGEK